MQCNRYGYQDQDGFAGQQWDHKHSRVANGQPQKKNRQDLCLQSDSLSLQVASYVLSKPSVAEKPLVEPF